MKVDSLLVELLPHCDRACRHCYNRWKHSPCDANTPFDWKELEPIVHRTLDELGCRSVTLLGGEPFLCRELFDAAASLRRRVEVAVTTHGGHLRDDEARRLLQVGVRNVELSFCADNGDGSCLPDACRAIAVASRIGLSCTASAVLARPFLPRLLEMAERALAFGATGFVLQPLVEPFAGALPDELVPTEAEWTSALQPLVDWLQGSSFPVVISNLFGSRPFPPGIKRLLSAPCNCATSRRVIDPWGRLHHCEAHSDISGSTRASTGDCPLLAKR